MAIKDGRLTAWGKILNRVGVFGDGHKVADLRRKHNVIPGALSK